MRYKIRIALLALSVLFLVPGGQVASTGLVTNRFASLASAPMQSASMTVPANVDPVVVDSDASPNTRGWSAGGSNVVLTGGQDIPSDVLAAYALAVAVSPPGCHLTVSLLAAIGQVESGNLAGHQLDSGHRVVPAILGPVLDGKPFQAVEDTDGGQWDGDRAWDRAMGPLQLIPSSWRVVSVDMDGDGVRDPQDIYDAAGAAMVYLCADGQDLGSEAGVKDAVLSYNHSAAYLKLVLAWKAVYDRTDLTDSGVPIFDAWAMPATAAAGTSPVTRTPHSRRATTNARPTTKVKPQTSPTTQPTSPPGSTPGTPTPSGTPRTPTPAGPTRTPDPSADPTADPTPEPTPEPTCPVPTPVDPTDPTAPVDPLTTVDPATVPSATPLDVPGSSTPDVDDPCAPVPVPTASPAASADDPQPSN